MKNWNAPMNMASEIIDDIDVVEIRAVLPLVGLMKYRQWTKVSRLLAIGLKGIEIREITNT
tara:strand:+ start:191 stop:373 length:183 start_codon:yes stop_codon:yes gene_type:complete